MKNNFLQHFSHESILSIYSGGIEFNTFFSRSVNARKLDNIARLKALKWFIFMTHSLLMFTFSFPRFSSFLLHSWNRKEVKRLADNTNHVMWVYVNSLNANRLSYLPPSVSIQCRVFQEHFATFFSILSFALWEWIFASHRSLYSLCFLSCDLTLCNDMRWVQRYFELHWKEKHFSMQKKSINDNIECSRHRAAPHKYSLSPSLSCSFSILLSTFFLCQ